MKSFPLLRRLTIECGASLGVSRLLRQARSRHLAVLTYHGFHDDERQSWGQ